MTGAGRAAVGMPTLGVCQRQPTDKCRQFAVVSRPNNKVPVVRHRTVGEQPRLKPRDSLFKNRLERLVVAVILEDRHPRVRTIEHVININGPQQI